MAARLTVACLARTRGHDQPLQELRQAGHHAWRLGLRSVSVWDLAPWTLRPWPVVRQPGCHGCGAKDTGLMTLEDLLQGEEP